MLAREIPEDFLSISNRWAAVGLLRTWAIALAGIGFACFYPSITAWILAVLLVGLAQYHLCVLGHHSLHRNLFQPAWLNELMARWLILAPIGMPLPVSRSNHMRHHVFFETPDDYEWEIYQLDTSKSTKHGFLFWLFSAYTGLAFILGFQRVVLSSFKEPKQKAAHRGGINLVDWIPVLVAQSALLIGLTLATWNIFAYPILWFLPIVTVMAGLSMTRACMEHVSPEDPARRLVTFPNGFMQRVILGPFNFNFHAEHHRFANVPPCNLDKLHFYLAERDQLDDTIVSKGYLPRIVQTLAMLDRMQAKPGPAANPAIEAQETVGAAPELRSSDGGPVRT